MITSKYTTILISLCIIIRNNINVNAASKKNFRGMMNKIDKIHSNVLMIKDKFGN